MTMTRSKFLRFQRWCLMVGACLASVLIAAPRASAVVIINTDQSANNGQTTDPGTGLPYENVGIRGAGGASVVYLGNQWCLTAAHVAVIPGNPSYGTVALYTPSMSTYENYTVDQTETLYNSNDSVTDLKLVHITSN